ncbi:BatD family protein [Dysgonomonas sp. ZJ279]|uniref:BatD family protein n=1 Tax=Dysgonomonas sp. ZJ279 TaxID=2709796 RepID=UPI0013EDBF8C|nr:BatD family protein [Dysgonomonas sp. ZJ279]
MRKYWFLLILLLIGITKIHAQDVSFVINAPASVVKGAQFQLQYILKGGSGKDIDVPENIKGFDVLFGPSISQVYSSSNINGKVTSESNVTYTYVVMAKEEGTFTLPAASIKVGGSNYTSNTKQIRVLPVDKNAQPTRPGQQPQAITSSSVGEVNPKDAFVRAIFSKTKVNEQEAVMVTFKFYTTLNIRSVGKIEFPEFEGFMTEEFDLPANRQWIMEHYNGRNYMTIDVKKTLLFPQRSGKITIPSGAMEIVFEVSSGQRVDTFFGPQDVMTETRKVLKTTPVTVDISPLPAGKPANFSGGLGTFALKPTISAQKIKANDAVTIKLDIVGTGNLKLIKTPEIAFPKDFETYDPKINNDFKITEKGLSGTKSIEYLFIPRYPGKFTIPPIEFSYYDTDSKSYKTLSSPAYDLEVEKDPNAGKNNSATSYMNQREVEVEQDIRYLKTGEMSFSNPNDFTVDTVAYLLWYIIPVVLFSTFLIVYRKQIKANSDIAMMRTKKANKVATKRLKLAKKYLATHNKDGFYEEVLRAVWGYLSDKLTIPVADLSRENIEFELLRYGADENLVSQYISILDTCEFARYAPAESDKAMDNLYAETVDAIGKMESTKRPS